MLSRMYRAAGGVGAIAAISLSGLFVGQRALLYPVPAAEPEAALPMHAERIELTEGYGLLLRPAAAPDSDIPLIIYAHGNSELAAWSIDDFAALVDAGFAVLLLEYPGYGGAEGSPSFDSIRSAMLESYDAAMRRPEFAPRTTIVYGRSLGGAAASLLAAEREVAALVLESTFASLPELVGDMGLPSILLRDRYDNLAIVRRLDIPVLLYHGLDDTLVPYEHGEQLAAAARQATLVSAACGHNDCPRIWPRLIEFARSSIELAPARGPRGP